ncbi:MAG: response regulator transcription factor [Eubacterium sp.]|nr:response regulator transcription factor [Eubacterium sp.]
MIIAIVDDDRLWMKKAASILEEYARGRNLSLEIWTFEDGQALLSHEGKKIDAIFLDIELKEESGIDLAAEINRRWKDCQIVFCTNYLHYAMDVYETNHTYFLVKFYMKELLGKVMDKIARTINENRQEVFYHVIRGGMTRFLIQDILYFERKTRFTMLVTRQGSFSIREKISEIIPDLPEGEFTRCHSSFLIKLSYIEKKEGSSYQLIKGEKIPISRKYLGTTKKEYLHWCEKQMN